MRVGDELKMDSDRLVACLRELRKSNRETYIQLAVRTRRSDDIDI